MNDKRARQRQRILECARLEFCASGIDNANMGGIAQRSDIARRTLYTYYADKDTLAEAVYLTNLSSLFGQMGRFIFRRDASPEQVLEDILRGYLDIRNRHPEYIYYDYIYNNYCAAQHRNPQKTDAFATYILEIYEEASEGSPLPDSVAAAEKFRCLHLYFCYLQKSVLQSIQNGDLYSKEQTDADIAFLEFLIKAIRTM